MSNLCRKNDSIGAACTILMGGGKVHIVHKHPCTCSPGPQPRLFVNAVPQHKCPNPECGRLNDDNWPLSVGDHILHGGCQDCWEKQCSESWWETMIKIDQAYHGT